MNGKAHHVRAAIAALAWAVVLCVGSSIAILRAQEPRKLSEAEARAAAVSKPEPAYPPIARQMRVTGKVMVEALVDADGKVEECHAVTGNSLLTPAAVAAVKKWTFKPFRDGDKAAKAVVQLTLSFSL